MYLVKNNFHSIELPTHLLILEFGVYQYPKFFMAWEKIILSNDPYSQVVTSYHLISAIKYIYSWFLRRITARGSGTGLVTVGPTKV